MFGVRGLWREYLTLGKKKAPKRGLKKWKNLDEHTDTDVCSGMNLNSQTDYWVLFPICEHGNESARFSQSS